MTQTPLGNLDCCYSRLLYSILLATSIFTETPVYDIVKNISLRGGGAFIEIHIWLEINIIFLTKIYMYYWLLYAWEKNIDRFDQTTWLESVSKLFPALLYSCKDYI